MSSLLVDVDKDRRLTIFDIGPALPETVEFFSQFKCRLYFADLFTEGVLGEQDMDTSATELQEELQNRFATVLDYPQQTRFDICLFWDVLYYLDAPGLSAFSKALSPFLSPTTGVHGFGTLKPSTKLPSQRYAIQRADCLRVTPREGVQAPCYGHSQGDLNKFMSGIEVGKATLLSGGLVEMLFRVSTSPAASNG